MHIELAPTKPAIAMGCSQEAIRDQEPTEHKKPIHPEISASREHPIPSLSEQFWDDHKHMRGEYQHHRKCTKPVEAIYSL
jgi:hypothetical protein